VSKADLVVRESIEAPVLYAGSAIAPSHPPSPGRRDLIQLRSTSTKSTSVIRESTARWPGRSSADSLAMRCRIVWSHSWSSVDFSRRMGGSNSNMLVREGPDRVKWPQIIVDKGLALPP